MCKLFLGILEIKIRAKALVIRRRELVFLFQKLQSMSLILQVVKKTKFTTKYIPAQCALLNYIIPFTHLFYEEFYKN
jgi:hypothetical protein